MLLQKKNAYDKLKENYLRKFPGTPITLKNLIATCGNDMVIFNLIYVIDRCEAAKEICRERRSTGTSSYRCLFSDFSKEARYNTHNTLLGDSQQQNFFFFIPI